MIKEFAEYLSLTVWDWVAVFVALCSLGVACASLVIAKRTLSSQRQTEKNTLPVININTQEVLLNKLLFDLLDTATSVKSMQLFFQDGNKLNCANRFIQGLTVDNSLIHLELYFNNPKMYLEMNRMDKAIKDFNLLLLSLNEVLAEYEKNNDIHFLGKFMNVLINDSFRLIYYWGKCVIPEELPKRIDSLLIDYIKQKEHEEEVMWGFHKDAKPEYKKDETFVQLCDFYRKCWIVNNFGVYNYNDITEMISLQEALTERLAIETIQNVKNYIGFNIIIFNDEK